jgi:hypothetical protein
MIFFTFNAKSYFLISQDRISLSREGLLKGRFITVDLLVLTSLDQELFILKI